MRLSPDQKVFWVHGIIHLNLTILTTWALMAVLVMVARVATRKLSTGLEISRWQNLMEMLVLFLKDQIKEVGLKEPEKYISFIGTVFIFIGASNLCALFPWYEPPTGSLSTTVALAGCVFLAVPFFGIAESGLGGYLTSYVKPAFIMLPFNLISEFSRTLALAVRLFGNMMSGGLIISILLSIAPLFFPIIMSALGILTGMVQAYIFGILATVYIAAATQDGVKRSRKLIIKNQ